MQQQFGQMQEKLKNTTVEGSAGNGLVSLTLDGEKTLKKISIHPECVTDIEGLQDLIVAAFADAASKINSSKDSMPSIPGLGF